MKALYTSIILGFVSIVQAQPTITNAVLPEVGSTSTFRLYNAENESPGASGAMVTWDFSGLVNNGSAIFEYKDPANMPAGGTFPSANLGLDQNGDPQLYFLASAQELLQIGGQLATLTEDYTSNPKELLSFPITFGTVLTDTFEGSATLGGFAASRLGSTVIEGDGYGTLILPYATFTNVLRVRNVSTYEDKIGANVINSGTDTVYSWYMEGIKDYLITWSNISSDQFGNVLYGAYLDTMYVGLTDYESFRGRVALYPNPSNDQITVEFQNYDSQDIQMQLLDLTGRLIKTWTFSASLGFVQERLSLSSFERGTYVLEIGQGDMKTVEKILLY